MTSRYIAILSICLLASCDNLGDRLSAINPVNLLGAPDNAEIVDTEVDTNSVVIIQPDDGKTAIPRVTGARLEYTASGVIARANGEAATLGYHSASLRPMNFGKPDGNGVIWFEFRAFPPNTPQPAGTELTRMISVANFIPNSRLESVGAVTITGAQNEVTIRLR